MNKNTSRCGLITEVSIMLWRNPQSRLSSSLKTMPLAIQLESLRASGTGGLVFPSHLNGSVEERGLSGCETALGFNEIGELINESEIVITGKGSAGLSIKGHYPKKDGVAACLLAAEAFTARYPRLSEPSSVKHEKFRFTPN